MGAKTRRLENNLMTVGTGVAAFGVWALVKYILTAFVLNEEIEDSMEPSRLAKGYIHFCFFPDVTGFFNALFYRLFRARRGQGQK